MKIGGKLLDSLRLSWKARLAIYNADLNVNAIWRYAESSIEARLKKYVCELFGELAGETHRLIKDVRMTTEAKEIVDVELK